MCCLDDFLCRIWFYGSIGLIKGALLAPLLIAITAPSAFVLAVLLLPHDVVYSFYTVAVTNRIGPNLKVAAMLLLPLPLCAWPFIVLAGTVAGWLVYGVFGQVLEAVSKKGPCTLSRAGEMVGEAFTFIGDFYDFNSNSVFCYLADLRKPSDAAAFDVGFFQMLIGLLQGIICVVLEVAAYACLGAVKLPFVILRCEWFLVSLSTKD